MAGTAGGVKAAKDQAQQAEAEVKQAENTLASGGSVTQEALHKLRDTWRHAKLSAQGVQARAEKEAAQARMDGLTAIGAQVDKLADSGTHTQLDDALAAVATACAKVRQLAGDHDEAVRALTAAATDLEAEPLAPAGPRASSAFVAVHDGAVLHQGRRVRPIGDQIHMALSHAVQGSLDHASEAARAVYPVRPQERPDHMLQGRSGVLVPVWGHLNTMHTAQLRSGDLVDLGEVGVDQWMRGEIE